MKKNFNLPRWNYRPRTNYHFQSLGIWRENNNQNLQITSYCSQLTCILYFKLPKTWMEKHGWAKHLQTNCLKNKIKSAKKRMSRPHMVFQVHAFSCDVDSTRRFLMHLFRSFVGGDHLDLCTLFATIIYTYLYMIIFWCIWLSWSFTS